MRPLLDVSSGESLPARYGSRIPYFTSVFSHPGRVNCEPENEADIEATWNRLSSKT